MHSLRSRWIVWVTIILFSSSLWAATGPTIELSVDATQAPIKMLHTHMTVPAQPGPLTLLYPKWIPGEHAPDGPVTDLTGLRFTAGGMFAMRVADTDLDEFRGVLSHRDVLLMVDVPKWRVAEVEEIVYRRHPEATAGGTGWTINALGI